MPETVLPEIASGLIRATGDKAATQEFLCSLKDIPHFSFVPVDGKLSEIAVEVIMKSRLRAADAIYVALALDYRIPLITLDIEQIEKGGTLIDVRRP